VRKRQLALFSEPPPLPSRPFLRWHRLIQDIQICTRCGREIITRKLKQDDTILAEYVSANGECWNCART
jgi:hypothetical protein